MPTVPSRVADRLVKGIKRFQPILTNSKNRDDGEADTVMVITDIFADVLGYDKYSEVTAEFAIRGTYCDLATKIDGALQMLIEVKAVGIELKDTHVKQAVDYAANQGIDWVILTNGICWRVYKVAFTKPIDHELVLEINFIELDTKNEAHIESLYLLCREGWIKSALVDFHSQRQALSRFCLGAMVLSEPVLDVIRRELRRLSPDVRIQNDQIKAVLASEVIKRDVMEGDKADEARKKVTRFTNRLLKAKTTSKEESPAVASSPVVAIQPSAPIAPQTGQAV